MKKINWNAIVIFLSIISAIIIVINVEFITSYIFWPLDEKNWSWYNMIEYDDSFTSTGVVSITTWSQHIDISTWHIQQQVPGTPSDPMWYIDHQMKYGVEWKDFFVIYPEEQPNLIYKTAQDNNEKILRPYGNDYIYWVSVWDAKGWYIMITTNKSVSSNRSLLLILNGKTMWAMNRSTSLPSDYDNQYIFDMSNISVWWYNINMFDYKKNWTIYLNASVWERDRHVDQIVIVPII